METVDSDGGLRDVAQLSTVTLLVVLVIEGILWALTRVFLLNFDAGGPDPSIAMFFLLATGWVVGLAALLSLGPDRTLFVAAALLAAGFLGTLFQSATVAGISGVILVTAATLSIVVLQASLRERLAVGVGIGILLAVALRVLLKTASPYATTPGTILLGGIVLGAAGLLVYLAIAGFPEFEWDAIGPAPAALGTLLIVAAGFLVHPQAIARWSLRSYELSVLAVVVGVAAGLLILQLRPVRASFNLELGGWIAAFLLSVFVLLYVPNEAAIVAFAIAWASAIVLLAAATSVGGRGSDSESGQRSGKNSEQGSGATSLFAFQLLALVFLALTVSATNWAFLPYPLSAAKGWGTELTLAFHAVYPAAVVYAIWLSGGTAGEMVDQNRRSAIATAATGLASLVGLIVTRPEPTSNGTGDASTIRAMAFNVHLYFEEEPSGQYSLAEIRELIAADGADVISLPESDAIRPLPGYVDGVRWLAEDLGFHAAFGAPTSMRSYGAALLSRWPIDDVSTVELPIGRSLTRVAITATIQSPVGSIPVVSTHLMFERPNPADDTRAEQVDRVVDLGTRHDRSIVLGDFNIYPEKHVELYESLTVAFTDAWLAADERIGTPETWSPSDPRERIDFVLLNGDWDVHEAKTIADPNASDHMAVVAELEPVE